MMILRIKILWRSLANLVLSKVFNKSHFSNCIKIRQKSNNTNWVDLTYSDNSLTYLYLGGNVKSWACLKFRFHISANGFRKVSKSLRLVLSVKNIEKIMCWCNNYLQREPKFLLSSIFSNRKFDRVDVMQNDIGNEDIQHRFTFLHSLDLRFQLLW